MEREEKLKALDAAIGQIERQFGKGAVMKLGDPSVQMNVETIPTGSLSLDIALGLGGIPKGRIVEQTAFDRLYFPRRRTLETRHRPLRFNIQTKRVVRLGLLPHKTKLPHVQNRAHTLRKIHWRGIHKKGFHPSRHRFEFQPERRRTYRSNA